MFNLENFDAFCFDLDGTIYLDNTLLPGVKETIDVLREQNKKVLFISNTSTQTREACKIRLNKIGIEVNVNEIITTTYLAARYFKDNLPKATVFMVGSESLVGEFQQFSIPITSNPLEASHVLVGLDPHFNYQKLNLAMQAVRHGAKLIMTNPDVVCPVMDGYIADTFVLTQAIATASEGEIDFNIGKPSSYYSQSILELLNIPKERCLIIGDRLETDILLGRNAGIKTCLVLTGVTNREDIETKKIYPDYVIENLSELVKVNN